VGLALVKTLGDVLGPALGEVLGAELGAELTLGNSLGAELGAELGPELGPTLELGPELGPTLGAALGPALGAALGPLAGQGTLAGVAHAEFTKTQSSSAKSALSATQTLSYSQSSGPHTTGPPPSAGQKIKLVKLRLGQF
jgi:hypothetical protein